MFQPIKPILIVCLLLPVLVWGQDSTKSKNSHRIDGARFEFMVNGGGTSSVASSKSGLTSERGELSPYLCVRGGMLVNPEVSGKTCIGLFYSTFEVRTKLASGGPMSVGILKQSGFFIDRSFGAGKLRPFIGINASAVLSMKGNTSVAFFIEKPKQAIGAECGLKYHVVSHVFVNAMANYNITKSINYYAISVGLGYRF